MMSKGIINSIERDYFLTSPEVVSSHVKAIGEAIIKDAEEIRLEPSNIASIKISAEIAPCTNITYVRYEIERRADPRIHERGDDSGIV
jgi:hypothetical protein